MVLLMLITPVCFPGLCVASFLASEQGAESFSALSSTSNIQPREVPFVLCCLGKIMHDAPLYYFPLTGTESSYQLWLHVMGPQYITAWL